MLNPSYEARDQDGEADVSQRKAKDRIICWISIFELSIRQRWFECFNFLMWRDRNEQCSLFGLSRRGLPSSRGPPAPGGRANRSINRFRRASRVVSPAAAGLGGPPAALSGS
jgi:hypothetical protein